MNTENNAFMNINEPAITDKPQEIKIEKFSDTQNFFHFMDYLIDVYFKKPLNETEKDIINYFWNMPLADIINMFASIFKECADYQLLYAFDTEPLIMKFMVMFRIQQERHGKGLI